jgi:hypothetical protein
MRPAVHASLLVAVVLVGATAHAQFAYVRWLAYRGTADYNLYSGGIPIWDMSAYGIMTTQTPSSAQAINPIAFDHTYVPAGTNLDGYPLITQKNCVVDPIAGFNPCMVVTQNGTPPIGMSADPSQLGPNGKLVPQSIRYLDKTGQTAPKADYLTYFLRYDQNLAGGYPEDNTFSDALGSIQPGDLAPQNSSATVRFNGVSESPQYYGTYIFAFATATDPADGQERAIDPRLVKGLKAPYRLVVGLDSNGNPITVGPGETCSENGPTQTLPGCVDSSKASLWGFYEVTNFGLPQNPPGT